MSLALLQVNSGNEEYTDNRCIKTGLKSRTNFTALHISGCRRLTDHVVEYINKCPTLAELDISCTNLTDQFLEKLTPKIQIINLWGCRKISAENTFKFIKSNPSIRMVMIDNLKDAHFISLKGELESLEDRTIKLIVLKEYSRITPDIRQKLMSKERH